MFVFYFALLIETMSRESFLGVDSVFIVMFKLKWLIATAVILIILILYKTELDLRSISAVSYDFRGIDPGELFAFLTYPDMVGKWFRWIQHFRAADNRPLGIGKRYEVLYNGQFLMFTIENYIPNERIVLTSESLLKPRIELRAFPLGTNIAPVTRLVISLAFRRTSAMFQLSVGPILREISSSRIQEAVRRLKQLLKHRSSCYLDPPLFKILD